MANADSKLSFNPYRIPETIPIDRTIIVIVNESVMRFDPTKWELVGTREQSTIIPSVLLNLMPIERLFVDWAGTWLLLSRPSLADFDTWELLYGVKRAELLTSVHNVLVGAWGWFLKDDDAMTWCRANNVKPPAKLIKACSKSLASTDRANTLDEANRLLNWNGQSYILTRNILSVIRVLFQAWEGGNPVVSIEQLRNCAEGEAIQESLYKVFVRRRKGKKFVDSSWDLIMLVGEGLYRLKE
jgi:hypothetical protein